jgi:mannose-1-phosphate guanylyltransferase
VKRFWEKPHQRQAAELMRLGCLWNSFVTVGRARTFVELLQSEVPRAVVLATHALANLDAQGAYDQLPTVTLRAMSWHSRAAGSWYCAIAGSGWADLGSPPRVFETLTRNGIHADWIDREQADSAFGQ